MSEFERQKNKPRVLKEKSTVNGCERALKKLEVIQNKAIYAITKTKSYKQKLAPLYHLFFF